MSDAVTVAAVSGAVALASAVLSLIGSQLASRRSTELTLYRISSLEEKVQRHNNLVERMAIVELKTDRALRFIEERGREREGHEE